MIPRFAVALLWLGAALTLLIAWRGDDGVQKLHALRASIERQEAANQHTRERLRGLEREVRGLQTDPRTIERAARNDLGMSRADEVVIIFSEKNP